MHDNVLPQRDIVYRSRVVSIPFVVPFRGIRNREVMILTNGERFGEWAAFPEYSDEISAFWLASALEQAYVSDLRRESKEVEPVAVNATFPALPAHKIPWWWAKFPGSKTVKVKVAEPQESVQHSINRLTALREVVGEDVKLRIDANGKWSVEEAEEALNRLKLEGFQIDYVEQPVASLPEMARLRSRLVGAGIRFAVDELIRQPDHLDAVFASGLADVAVLKVSPLGGIENTVTVARRAHSFGLDVVLSSALETSIGLSWGIHAATIIRKELGSLPDAGLGTTVLFAEDLVVNPIRVSEGVVPVHEPEVDEGQVRKLAASAERTQWWRERLKRCLPLAVGILESRKSRRF